MKTFLKDIYWYVLLVLIGLSGFAIGALLGNRALKQFELGRQAEHEYVIKQIESADSSYPRIILSGKYSAERYTKPSEACIQICKIRKIDEEGK